MRPFKTLAPLPVLLAALAVLVAAGPAFARGGTDHRQVVQAAFVKGSHRAGQAHFLRLAGSRSVYVLDRRPEGDVVDGDVVDGKRLRLIGARSAVVMARDLNRLAELVERNRARQKRYEPPQFGRYVWVT